MIELQKLTKAFTGAGGTVEALRDIDLTIPDGEIYGVIGMSGAGKSTLVRCINMLERPTSGKVVIDGRDMAALPPEELRRARRDITMIFQGFNLLMQCTCQRNVSFPLELAGMNRSEAMARAAELMETVGLGNKLDAYPSQLSGGQKQRVAIARALATSPKILLCDEATSALDPQSTQAILSLIREIHDRLGLTVVMITHQMSVVEQICTRVAILDNGTVAEEGPVSDVFSAPKSAPAKRLVYPDGYEQGAVTFEGGALLRVVFNGAKATMNPLIARMAIDRGVTASIIAASTRSIGVKTYGNMLLGILGGQEALATALDYLRAVPDILAEEVVPNA